MFDSLISGLKKALQDERRTFGFMVAAAKAEAAKFIPKRIRFTEALDQGDCYVPANKPAIDPFWQDKHLVRNTPAGTLFLNDGKKASSIVMATDIAPGAPSPALWGLFVPMAVFSLLTALVAVLVLFVGYPAVAMSINDAYSAAPTDELSAFGRAWDKSWSTLGSLYVGTMWLNLLVLIPHGARVWFTYLSLVEQDPGASTSSNFAVFMAVVALFAVVVPVLGPAILGLYALYLIFAKTVGEKLEDDKRTKDLQKMSQVADTSALEKERRIQVEQSVQQALGALANTAKCNVAFGRVTRDQRDRGDFLAPDPGTPMFFNLLSENHMEVKGRTGAGKTTFLAPYANAWCEQACGGMLVIDGLGLLPLVLRGVLDIVITPEAAYIRDDKEPKGYKTIEGDQFSWNLAKYLSSNSFQHSIKAVSNAGGENKIFDDQAGIMGRNTHAILSALDEALQSTASERRGDLGKLAICFQSIHRVCQSPAAREVLFAGLFGDPLGIDKAKMAKKDKALSAAVHRKLRMSVELESAFEYLQNFAQFGEETAGSVLFNLSAITDDLMTDRVRKLTGTDDALRFDIVNAIVNEGKTVAFSAPESRYGRAGKILTNMVFYSVINELKKRDKDTWQAEGKKPVLFMVDEAREFAFTKQAATDISQIRNMGGRFCLSFQQDDQRVAELGGSSQEDEANSMAGNALDLVLFQSSKRSYEAAAHASGKAWRSFAKDEQEIADAAASADSDSKGGEQNFAAGRVFARVRGLTSLLTTYMRGLSVHNQKIEQEKSEQEVRSVKGRKIIETTWITETELSSELQRRFHAFVIHMQEGVAVRAVVDFTPKFLREKASANVPLWMQRALKVEDAAANGLKLTTDLVED